MWFASIWIFTLKLPWELGACFFLEHLLDGDPASNTLSWRWVAGLQTPGKHYLARAENIARYTAGQLKPRPGDLDESADPLPNDGLSKLPAARPVLGPDAAEVRPQAVLLHDEDHGPLPASWQGSPAIRYALPTWPHHSPSPLVKHWIASACADADTRTSCEAQATTAGEIIHWCQAQSVREVWTLRPHAGFTATAITQIADHLKAIGIQLCYADRAHDVAFFPLAIKGFFPFWEAAAAKLRRRWI